MFLGALPFFFSQAKYFTSALKLGSLQAFNPCVVCATPQSLSVLFLYMRYSFAANISSLLDLGCLEGTYVNAKTKGAAARSVLWYIFAVNAKKVLTLSWSSKQKSNSIETLFRNAKWLEREASEMHGWFFAKKKDRRTLFLLPVFFLTPLKKTFPTGGFFEVALCPTTHNLTFKHTSWLS